MSYLIQKTISKGGFKYWAKLYLNHHAMTHFVEWNGLIGNGHKFKDKDNAQEWLDMIDSEMKSTDNSELTIIEL